jgi:hypothetical protein
MTSFRIRPRFSVQTNMAPDAVKLRFSEALTRPDASFEGAFFPQHIILRLPEDARHLWSPRLEIALEPHDEGTLIRGLYGPSPQVWTFFTISYGAIGVLALFVTIIGTSQLMLDLPGHTLWALPLLGGIALFLYMLSQTGQKLGAEQTFALHHFFEDTLTVKTPVS